MNGKYIVIQAPANGGSTYCNYKGSHSIVLMAVCDSHYRFILVDIGDAGRQSDEGMLANSEFGQVIENQSLHIPRRRPLSGTSGSVLPFVFIGNEAFPLKENKLWPYPGRNLDESLSIFNYHLIQAKIALEFWQLNGESFVSQLLPTQTMLCCIPKQQLYFTTFFKQQCSIYCPVGFIDAEDDTGNVINGTW